MEGLREAAKARAMTKSTGWNHPRLRLSR
jgi:hypothetical protein